MSDPKNKWKQPPAPPAPMFFGKKERDLVKQVNDELSERIIGQPIAYYPISLEESNFNETYGEAVEKISLPPVRVFAYVVVDNEQTNERYGYEYQTKLTVNFHRRRLVEDQDLYVRVGDFVQYGDEFYEIVRLYNDTRYLFGQVEHKFQVTAECVRARRGVFKVMPGIDRPVTEAEAAGSPDAPAPRPAPYPPLAATYITVTPESKLPNERVLKAGIGITLTDTGANGTLTVASTANAAVGPTGSIQISVGDVSGSFYGDSTFLYLTASDTLSLSGYLTASGHISSSTFYGTYLSSSAINLLPTSGSLAGLGSYLALDAENNIIVTSSLGTGLGGIFTTINGSQAYVTSSLAIGGTSAPDHQVSVSGSMSASVNVSASAFYGDGSPLTSLTIGAAEDSSYADGLFADFTNTTPVGTAVDRFNEILKALSPGPAPDLDNVDCDDTGASAQLSFGASQGIAGYTNVGTDAGFSAVDINGTYTVQTSANNLRRGTFNGSRVINGDLNEDVSADGVNYPANSFGDADKGDLVLEVNGATLHTASMADPGVGTGVPGSGTGTNLNGNGSGFYDLSQTGSAEFDDGTPLDLFQHRTGKYKVTAADQQEGWNYLRVVHTSSTFDRTTNYVAWVNDSNSNPLTPSGEVLDTLVMTGDLRLSGVKYHTGGTAEYRVAVSNAYRNVYTATNISYTVTNGSISSEAMPTISVGSEDETKILSLTGSLVVDGTSILDSSIAAGVNVAHPLKSNLSNGGNQSIGSILAYNRPNNSTSTSETFRRENFRLESGSLSSYGAQADVTDPGNAWDSSGSLLTVDGLLFYNERLYSPTDGDIPNNGDFSAIANGPAANVDYSGITGARTFFRYFTSPDPASETNFRLSFTGDTSTRIVPATTALSSTDIHVFVKLPTTTTAMSTGWLDLGTATANDPAQLSDGDGAYVGTPPAGGLEINSDTHEGTFVTQTVEQNESLVIKIVADAAWSGYISALSIAWGSS